MHPCSVSVDTIVTVLRTVLTSRVVLVISASALLFVVGFEEVYQMSSFFQSRSADDKAFSFPLPENVSISHPFPGVIFWATVLFL